MVWDQCRSPPGELRGPAGRVHSISARGTGEGPGVRFVIFLHGCPLRCTHCSDRECRGSDGGAASAIDELVKQIAHYADFMRISGGGVTVAGAEPLEQAQFVRELFRRCREMGIRTALDTSGSGNLFAAKGLLHLTDLVVLDVTGFDSETLSGGPPGSRLRFAGMLRNAGKPVWVRFAVLPGVNDDPSHVEALAEFAAALPDVEKVEVVAFHRMPGIELRDRCPLPVLRAVMPPSARQIRSIRNIFRSRGLRAD